MVLRGLRSTEITVAMVTGLMKAGGSVTLLKGPQNIIVDTGSPWDRELLLSGNNDLPAS